MNNLLITTDENLPPSFGRGVGSERVFSKELHIRRAAHPQLNENGERVQRLKSLLPFIFKGGKP